MKRFQGQGEVVKDGKLISPVHYDLRKTMDRVATPGGYIEGQSRTTGSITFMGSDLGFEMGEVHTLRLANGKEVAFHATYTKTRGTANPRYDITVSGDPEA